MTLNTLFPRGYGAVELKASYNRNLALAFLLAMVLFGAAIAIYSLLVTVTPIERIILGPTGGTIWDPIPAGPPPSKPTTSTSGPSGGTNESGGPVSGGPGKLGPIKQSGGLPLPDSMSLNNGFEFTGTDPDGTLDGNGNGTARDSNNEGGHTRHDDGPPRGIADDRDLSPDVPVFVEKDAAYDEGQLARALKYPEIARRAGLEGKVVVRVLIDRTGKPVRTMIDLSDNPAFVDAAVRAVTSIVYTPAIQNKTPVAVWMQIPINFTIDR